ncbi:MAG: HupE/UreJ family protein [Alphaproteobacteria bacterium]
MSSRRFILMMVAVFILGALPFLILQPNAAASSGLSHGFRFPLEHFLSMFLLLMLGLLTALLPLDGALILPLGFLLLVLVGAVTALGISEYPGLRYFLLAGVLGFALLVGLARHKATMLSVMLLGSLGFHYGLRAAQAVPEEASPLYFLLGLILSLTTILPIAVAFGVTLFSEHDAWVEKLKNTLPVRALREFFR